MERCLKSIQEQTFTNFECILVDNNSSDRGALIAKGVCEKDARFRLIPESRQGVVHAFQSGYGISRGKYIARMDADDEAMPNRLEDQYAFLENEVDIAAVAGLVEYVGDEAQNEGFARFVRWSNRIVEEEDLLKKRFIEFPLVNPSLMFRRERIEDYGLYESGDFPEDYELFLRWISKGARIAKLEKTLLRWYDSATRLTRTDSIYREEAFYRIKTSYLVEELRKVNPFFPEVYVWGASRLSRKRARLLEGYGVKVKAYIDIHERRSEADFEVMHYEELLGPGDVFVLVYMGMEKARKEIGEYLSSRCFIEGENYLFVS